MLYDLLRKARSYRNFDPSVTYTTADLTELVNLCRFAPSSVNRQPLRFAYAYKKQDCGRIFPLLGWAALIKEDKPPYPGNEPTAYILICYDTDFTPNSPDTDVGIYAQTIVLGAMEKGIGACMIGSINKPKLAEIFALPANIVPRLIIALGAPNEKIVLTEAKNGETNYYRDEEKTHYVPKRTLTEILLPEIK
jgi:nitroreductase